MNHYVNYLRTRRGLSTNEDAFLKKYDRGEVSQSTLEHLDRLYFRSKALGQEMWLCGIAIIFVTIFVTSMIFLAIYSL